MEKTRQCIVLLANSNYSDRSGSLWAECDPKGLSAAVWENPLLEARKYILPWQYPGLKSDIPGQLALKSPPAFDDRFRSSGAFAQERRPVYSIGHS